MTPSCSSVRRRRRQGDGERCRRSASAALEIRPSVWRMASIRRSMVSRGMIISCHGGSKWIISHGVPLRPEEGSKRPGIGATLPRMPSTRTGAALYVGAVLGPGVLFLPALAARAAGPASILAWAALLALSAPLAVTFAALGVRHPEAGGTAAYARAAF